MAETLEEHFGYLADSVKVKRYREAIEQAVKSGSIVVDLGCGSGLLGLMALEAGAGKVFFVEEGSVIEIARKTIAQAGFADRARFFRANSFELSLPERADLVICDHVGYFGIDYGILALLADARARFLKPDGAIIPEEINLMLGPVDSDECRKLVAQWRDGSIPADFEWLAATSANTRHALNLTSDDLLASAATLGSLQQGSEDREFISFDAEFECLRSGLLDGVAGWFDCRLFGDVSMNNSPTAEDRLRRPQAFLPLESPVTVKEGELVKATIMVRPLDSIIAWIIELPSSGQKFSHTTFNGLLLDRETMLQAQPDRVAALNDKGRALDTVLSYCDGKRSVADVQAAILRDHPDLFPSEQATKSFVQQVLAQATSE